MADQSKWDRPYVALSYNIWPEVYKPDPTYAFPNLEAARRFAQNNLTKVITETRLYSSKGELLETFTNQPTNKGK